MKTYAFVGTVLLVATATAGAAKRERATVSLPLIVEDGAVSGATRVAQRELFGMQNARYRSVAIATAGAAPAKLKPQFAIAAGDRLIELEASAKTFTGSVFCKPSLTKTVVVLTCLSDGDRDGAFEKLWMGSAASLNPVVPYPDLTMFAEIARIRYTQAAASAPPLRVGFYISGTNPLLGQHHFYMAFDGERGPVPFMPSHRKVRLGSLPEMVDIQGARLQIERADKAGYSIAVSRPLAAGEHKLVASYPKRTQYIFIPG